MFLYRVSKTDSSGPRSFGFINDLGKIVITPDYAGASDYREGAAVVVSPRTGKCGLIGEGGESILPYVFDDLFPPSDGICRFLVNESSAPLSSGRGRKGNVTGIPRIAGKRYGFVRMNGDELISPKYERAEDFREGIAAVRLEGKPNYVCINVVKKQMATSYGFTPPVCSNGVILIEGKNGKFGYLSREGEEIIKCKFTLAGPFNLDRAFVKVEEAGAVGLISKTGDWIMKPKRFLWGDRFSDCGFACVTCKIKGKHLYGFVNTLGEEVIVPQYSAAKAFTEGLAAVEIKGKWGFINSKNEIIVEPGFTSVEMFKGPLAEAVRGRFRGYINPIGSMGLARECLKILI